jgi:hypothetical protein
VRRKLYRIQTGSKTFAIADWQQERCFVVHERGIFSPPTQGVVVVLGMAAEIDAPKWRTEEEHDRLKNGTG